MTGAIVCSFSAGLDELTRKQQADPAIVLGMLKARGRFSAFEASDNDVIARMITRLLNKGLVIVKDDIRTEYGKLIEDIGGSYPWVNVRVTEGGDRFLKDQRP